MESQKIPGYVWVAIAAGAFWYMTRAKPAQAAPNPYAQNPYGYDPSQYQYQTPPGAFVGPPADGYSGGGSSGYSDPGSYAAPPAGLGPSGPGASGPSTQTSVPGGSVPGSVLPPSLTQPSGQTASTTLAVPSATPSGGVPSSAPPVMTLPISHFAMAMPGHTGAAADVFSAFKPDASVQQAPQSQQAMLNAVSQTPLGGLTASLFAPFLSAVSQPQNPPPKSGTPPSSAPPAQSAQNAGPGGMGSILSSWYHH